MRDILSTVESLLNEHEAIRGHMKQVRESVNNLESLPQHILAAKDKRENLKQAIGYLEDGLRTHHQHEDAVMPQLVGELIMQAIRLEHSYQLVMFKKISPALNDNNIDHFLSQLVPLKTNIENLCQATSLHSLREDGILHFLRKVPQQSPQPPMKKS